MCDLTMDPYLTEASKAEKLSPSSTSAATAARVQGVLSLADIAISKSRAVKSSLACATGTPAPLPSLTPDYATKLSELSGVVAGVESGSAALEAIQTLAKINLAQPQQPAEIITDNTIPVTSKAARRAQMVEEFGDLDLFGTGITTDAAEMLNANSPTPAPVAAESKAARRAQVVEEFGDSNIFGSRNIGASAKESSEKPLHRHSSDQKNLQKSTTVVAATEGTDEKNSSSSKLRRHQSERKLVGDVTTKKEGECKGKPPRAKQPKRGSSERHLLNSCTSRASAATGGAEGSSQDISSSSSRLSHQDISSSSSRLSRHKSDRKLARSSTANAAEEKSKDLRRRDSRRRLTESKKDGTSFRRTKSLEEAPATAVDESPLNSSTKDRRSKRRSETATKRSSGVRSTRQGGRRNVGTCQVQQAITAGEHKDDADEEKKKEESNDILNGSNDTLSTHEDSSGSLLREEEAPDPVPATGFTARKSFFGSIQLPSLSAMTSQQELEGSQTNDNNNNDSAGEGQRSSFFSTFSSNATATNAKARASVTTAAMNMTTALFGGQYKGMDGDTEDPVKDNQDNDPASFHQDEDPAATKKEENDPDNSGSLSHTEDDNAAAATGESSTDATETSPRRTSGSCPATLVKARQRQRRAVSRRHLSNGKGVSSRQLPSSRKLGAAGTEHGPEE